MRISDKTLEQVKNNRALIESKSWLEIWETLKNSELNGAFVELGYNPLEGLKQVPRGYFYRCPSLKSIEIPSSVTSIGDYAFSGCSGLTSIVIPDSVTSIGYYAFEDCSSLANVEMGLGLKSLDNYLFASCPLLNEIIYHGTKKEAKSLFKVLKHYSSVGKIVCTDGEISL